MSQCYPKSVPREPYAQLRKRLLPDSVYECSIFRLMVQSEQVDPVPDVLQIPLKTVTLAWK
ncbi:MAG: hypothetical protein ACYC7D_03305 [Nitrososphaerales archaeon]